MAVDPLGNLYFTDYEAGRVRKVSANGIITTVAGNGSYGFSGDGGAATNATLGEPAGVAVDASGNLFIADVQNNRIRRVDSNGIITTLAGDGAQTDVSPLGDGGAATNASFYSPGGVVVDISGNIYIADTENNRVRKVSPRGPSLSVANVNATDAGSYQVIVSSAYGSVTSNIATLAVSSPQISAARNPNGSVTLNLLTAANVSSRVLAATNLAPPFTWQSLTTNIPGASGVWQFTDTNASRYGGRPKRKARIRRRQGGCGGQEQKAEMEAAGRVAWGRMESGRRPKKSKVIRPNPTKSNPRKRRAKG